MKLKVTPEPIASQIMNKHVEMVRGHDSINDVASLFTDHFIGSAVVLNAYGQPVGVITKTDLVRYQTKRAQDPTSVFPDTAENWMTGAIFSVKPNTPLKEVASRMIRYGIHHMFVKKPDSNLLGIVSSFDILRAIIGKEVPRANRTR